MAKKNCVICGKEGYSYFPFCYEHLQEKNAGKIVKCEDCGTWHYADKPCKNCGEGDDSVNSLQEKKKEKNDELINNDSSELTCIICGEPSNGKHFCRACYNKYKNKVVYLQIKQCKEYIKLDAEYESDFVCDDGHLVKSPYEKIIDNWLYKENIQHAYEIKIDIDKESDLTPDFYIPEYNGIKDIYVEFWGYDETNIKYQRTKEYKMKIYPKLVERDGITVIYLNKKEVENDTYKKKIKYAEQGKINE